MNTFDYIRPATIADAKLSNTLEYFGVFAFCLWCTASYLTMEIYAVARPELGRNVERERFRDVGVQGFGDVVAGAPGDHEQQDGGDDGHRVAPGIGGRRAHDL